MWDSILAGKMAKHVMDIEEENALDGQISEYARVTGTRFSFSLQDRMVVFKCFVGNPDATSGTRVTRVREGTIKW